MVDQLKIGPDIFVSLKEGGVGKYYKIGKTLGEGNASFRSFSPKKEPMVKFIL
jgi:hypothetical protein